ncbi:MAG: hypothetical protein KDK40_04025 [Chlamydiia bacterium]|nr:hypothetical protein [Chlamydiia bacterium]
MQVSTDFQDLIYTNPFYKAEKGDTFSSLKASHAIPADAPTYNWKPRTRREKIRDIAFNIFSLVALPCAVYNYARVAFPCALYRYAQIFAGCLIIPSVFFSRANMLSEMVAYDEDLDVMAKFHLKRGCVKVKDRPVDVLLLVNKACPESRRWVLYSGGNGQMMETFAGSHRHIFAELNSHIVLFNYPGTGASCGWATRESLTETYLAMMDFVEDPISGLGAKEAIYCGFSIGGVVQGEALKQFDFQKNPDVRRLFIKDRTLTDLHTVVSKLVCRPLAYLVSLLGWNMSSKESSEGLNGREILIDASKDTIIRKGARLGDYLDQKKAKNKIYIDWEGASHNDFLDFKIGKFLIDQCENSFKTD